jgi:hypothetical protein
VALVRTDYSVERIASIIKMAKIILMEINSSETSIVTTATRRNIPEDIILNSQRLENLKSWIALTGWAL